MTQYILPNETQRAAYFNHLLNNPSDMEGIRLRKSAALHSGGVTHLYKYCKLETARKILANGLLLQAPDNYNDPFDCLSGVSVWSASTRFSPEPAHIERALSLVNTIVPPKYRLPQYSISSDMRASYYFATTCFSESFDNHLMWSHYGGNHDGLCLEFEVEPVFDILHPCYYTDTMPQKINWRTGDLALATIKGSPWAYEREWRLVKETCRPFMRVLGDITHQIYNGTHANPAFSIAEFEEWNLINTGLQDKVRLEYDQERVLNIRPSRIILGLNLHTQYTNETTAQSCEEIRELSKLNGIPVLRMLAKSGSFGLVTKNVINRLGWSQPAN